MSLPLILASESPARLALLKRINIIPDKILPAHLDERQLPKEKPTELAKRLARQKAEKIAEQIEYGIIIAADTVPIIGRSAMRKAENEQDIRQSLQLIAGRRHRVYSAVHIIYRNGKITKSAKKIVKSILKFKLLNKKEIDYYCQLGEGIGKAGGYTIGGYAESYVEFISGSYSNVIGLPLAETVKLLAGLGYSLNK